MKPSLGKPSLSAKYGNEIPVKFIPHCISYDFPLPQDGGYKIKWMVIAGTKYPVLTHKNFRGVLCRH